MSQTIYGNVFQDSGAILTARIYGSNGSLLTQSAVSSIACTVSDITTGTPATVISPSITVSDVVFNSLQTDAIWTKDATGYNFKHAMPATGFPDAGHVYQVSYVVTPSSGAVFEIRFIVTAS